jgi:hypothetical protein
VTAACGLFDCGTTRWIVACQDQGLCNQDQGKDWKKSTRGSGLLYAVCTLLCTLAAMLRAVAIFVMHCHLQFYVQSRVFLPGADLRYEYPAMGQPRTALFGCTVV